MTTKVTPSVITDGSHRGVQVSGAVQTHGIVGGQKEPGAACRERTGRLRALTHRGHGRDHGVFCHHRGADDDDVI